MTTLVSAQITQTLARPSSPQLFDPASERKSPKRARSVNIIEESKRNAKNFRYLVLLIFVSVLYDICWFLTVDQSSNDLGDGG